MALPAWQQALLARSQALNQKYGLAQPAAAPKPAAAPAPAPASQYSSYIQADPAYVQGTQDLRAQGDAYGAQSADAVRRAIIEYGMVPEGYQDPYGWVNDETRQLAAKNTAAGLSRFAQLQRAYQTAVKQGRRALAARGMLQSGALTQTLGEADLNNRLNQYNALQGLLDTSNAQRFGYAQNMLGLQQQQTGLARDASTRAAAYAPSAPAAPAAAPVRTTAAAEPAWQRALRLRSQAMNARYGL